MNVSQLKLLEQLDLEDNVVISHPKDTIPNSWPPLDENALFDVCICTIRYKFTTAYFECKGSLPTQAKWIFQ